MFSSAIYALETRAALQKDEVRMAYSLATQSRDDHEANKSKTVLIHSASGGLGQAAIQIARNIGAEVDTRNLQAALDLELICFARYLSLWVPMKSDITSVKRSAFLKITFFHRETRPSWKAS